MLRMLFITSSFLSFLILTFLYFTYSKDKIILSPLPEKTYAESYEPTTTPTYTPTPTLTPTPIPPTPTYTPTPLQKSSGQAPSDLEDLFSKYSSEYSVDKDLLKRIAQCESGMRPDASNLGYAGLYQFAEQSWISARSRMGLINDVSLRLNPDEAIKTAAFMISEHKLHIWPNCSK